MDPGTVSNHHGVLSRKGPLGLANHLTQNGTESWSKSHWCDFRLQLFLGLAWESSVDTLRAKWESQALAKGRTVPSRLVKCQSSDWAGVPRGNMVLWEISRLILGNRGSGVSCYLHNKRGCGLLPLLPTWVSIILLSLFVLKKNYLFIYFFSILMHIYGI